VSKQIVTSQSFIGKKLNKSTSFDIDKAADTIAEELISKKIQKNVHDVKWFMEKRMENFF
jgi:fructose-1,6-bisphosphatase/inositol monophosphatase family enzyme